MRKLNLALASASALILCAIATGTVHGQTTFASTNNPNAHVALQMSDKEVRVTVTQEVGAATYQPISQNTGLRDGRTGITYSPTSIKRNASKSNGEEEYVLLFDLPTQDLGEVTLLDVANQAAALYFTGIRYESATASIIVD